MRSKQIHDVLLSGDIGWKDRNSTDSVGYEGCRIGLTFLQSSAGSFGQVPLKKGYGKISWIGMNLN
ncbi:MAG: hypothetical protein QQN41_14130 [Nitrosopumilus sp.]